MSGSRTFTGWPAAERTNSTTTNNLIWQGEIFLQGTVEEILCNFHRYLPDGHRNGWTSSLSSFTDITNEWGMSKRGEHVQKWRVQHPCPCYCRHLWPESVQVSCSPYSQEYSEGLWLLALSWRLLLLLFYCCMLNSYSKAVTGNEIRNSQHSSNSAQTICLKRKSSK